MNKLKLLLVPFAFQVFGLTVAYADAPKLDIKCYSVASTRDFGYCTHQVKGSTNHEVLYYLHGAGSSEYEWQNSTALSNVYEAWGTNAPAVITISYGRTWMLAEKNDSSYSGLLEHFTEVAMPWAEKQLGYVPTSRILIGLSMGGFNASQLYLKRPGLFRKVELLCPLITNVSPYDSYDAINAYTQRTRAQPNQVARALNLTQTYYPNAAIWNQAAPIALANATVSSASAPIFVSVGAQDEYGFFEGAKAFADQVTAKGGMAKFILVQGGHCSFDAAAAVEFITQ
jgi:pimeloyl-ACP methyl ester carboxylesterase